ncbi:hypothetical protein NKR17_13545 [Priestia flexa]|nr:MULTISPECIES: hypothetical protein [Bacillaceae]MCP1190074.1 hypothetical protein [Priestia flexa]MED4590598.1 hypothetical protein [Priestia flexa]SCB98881.1 hypothetical protein GA0061087_100689 [Priestia flexa]
MAGKKKPKYRIGDTIVVTIYGTVGTITDINFLLLLVMCYDFIMTH